MLWKVLNVWNSGWMFITEILFPQMTQMLFVIHIFI